MDKYINIDKYINNEENQKYLIFILTIVLIPLFFYIILPLTHEKSTIHIIITRYKEPDLSIILKPFVNKKNIKVFIYNKGDDVPTGIPMESHNISLINIPNLGWDSYGYLFHLINNYDNLPTYIANIHASAQYLQYKYTIFLEILEFINNIDENKIKFYGGSMDTAPLNFRLEDWNASLPINAQSSNQYTQSSIYPLNNWLLSKIKTIPKKIMRDNENIYCNYFGQFIVHRSRILKYTKSFYINLLEEISVWQSEVNHYLERSWYTFYASV
jgi:hypothetical protein